MHASSRHPRPAAASQPASRTPTHPPCLTEEGIVPGGGTALVYASRSLEAVKQRAENFDQKVGVGIIQKAIRVPAATIANNAGEPK